MGNVVMFFQTYDNILIKFGDDEIKKTERKIFLIHMLVVIISLILTGCGQSSNQKGSSTPNVSTTFNITITPTISDQISSAESTTQVNIPTTAITTSTTNTTRATNDKTSAVSGTAKKTTSFKTAPPPASSAFTIDGYDRATTFNNLFKISWNQFFYANGNGKIFDGLHYGTGTRTGSSQFGGDFFGDFTLPDEIKDNVIAMNKFDLFSDTAYKNPLMAGAVLEIQHVFLNNYGTICGPIGTTQDKAHVIVTDSMFDEGRITWDIDIFTTTYDKIKGGTQGSGCLFVSWRIVDFTNLSKNLKLSYVWKEANNPYYLTFKLLWHKLPVKSVSYNGTTLPRTQDNFFQLPNQTVTASGSVKIKIFYLDGTIETVTIGGPKDKTAHIVTY